MKRDEDFSSIISEQADRQFRQLTGRESFEAAGAGHWLADSWRSLEESALPSALVPEARGGVGVDATDAFEIVRLSGYRGLPLPLGDTMIARALWSDADGDIGLAADSPMLLGPTPRGQPLTLKRTNAGFCVGGTTEGIPLAGVPASVLLPACTGTGEDFLLLLDAAALPGAPRTSPGFEGRIALQLDDLAVAPERCRPWDARQPLAFRGHGALVRSLQMTGAMQRCVELGLQYAAERLQFGSPIGRFAPVRDMLVEAAAEAAAAIASARFAQERWQPSLTADGVFCIAAAKSRCGEAAGKVSAFVHQVHGAIGFTQEHILHRFTRNLWAWRDDFGSESFWNLRLGEQACSSSGDGLWQRISSL